MAKLARSKSSKSLKSSKPAQSQSYDTNAILKDVEVQFWSTKKFSSNPRYPEKFALTVLLSEKHINQLEPVIEAAIEEYKQKEEDYDVTPEDFKVSFYEQNDGTVTYTFRSDSDYREITALMGEEIEDVNEVRPAKGTKINLAVRASAICVSRGNYYCVIYANAINIKEYVPYVGGRQSLLQSLID